MALALSPLAWWQSVWRETNSHAATRRGQSQYASKQYDPAAKSFASADKLASSPRTAFDLGTAHIAAGQTTEGSATLSRAMTDPALRADSYYNRGNSALASKAYEYAIRDYVESLKLRPDDRDAKRNLEIAMERLSQLKQQQKSGGWQGQQQPSPSQTPNQKAPSAGQRPEEQKQESDADALLRSVQQQEQEELQRMKRTHANDARVGW